MFVYNARREKNVWFYWCDVIMSGELGVKWLNRLVEIPVLNSFAFSPLTFLPFPQHYVDTFCKWIYIFLRRFIPGHTSHGLFLNPMLPTRSSWLKKTNKYKLYLCLGVWFTKQVSATIFAPRMPAIMFWFHRTFGQPDVGAA